MADLNNSDGIRWGKIKESTDETRIFYSSFSNEGLEYSLYDNVEIYDESKVEPHIGKIMKLWEERGSGKKQVLIRWYFRATELPQLNSEENSKELYLAFGKGKGVINVNDLEVIYGKCKVLCTTQDPQNRQPSENDLKSADYFFSSVYNVDRGQLSAVQRVADKLGYDVVFNKQEWVTEGIKTEDNLARLVEINPEGNSVEFASEVNASTKHETPSADTGFGSLPQESKKRQREVDVMQEAHKKRLVQQAEKQSAAGSLKRANSNIDETSKNKKLKVLDKGKNTSPREVLAKPGGTPIVSPDASINSVKVKEEVNSTDPSPRKQKALPQTELVQGKLQTSKTEKPSAPKEFSTTSTGNLGNSAAHSPKAAKDEVRNKVQALKSSTLGLSGQSQKKSSDVEKTSLLGDTLSNSPVSLTDEKSSPKVDSAMEALACLAGAELPANEKKSNKMDEKVSGDAPSADGNDMKASPKTAEVSLGKINNFENRKVGDVAKSEQDISHLVKEGSSSEKRRLVKATENSRVLQTSIAKKEDEGRTGDAPTDQEGRASGAKTPKQQKIVSNLKSDKGKVNIVPMPGTGISSDKNAVKKKLKGAADEAVRKSLNVKSDLVKSETNLEKRRIFRELPWEENLQQGLPSGRVVLVQNFDPLATSAEVRDMMKSIFEGFSDARVMPQDTLCPYGQALAIFETKGSADSALQAIESKCLVLSSSKRPLIASRATAPESSRLSRFPGHLLLEKYKLSRAFQNEDMRRAVATSHSSQPNTIEFEMAIEWRLLQEVTQLCRVELFKTQRKEIEAGKRTSVKKS